MSNTVLHDLLLDIKPETAQHNEDTCPICSEKKRASQEGTVADAIFSQEQHERLLAAAVEKAKEEATADSDAEILRLNEQLTQANEKASALESKVEELESTIKDREEQDRLTELADERAEKVKAVASFSDEQIEQRKMSWAKKDDEEFEALLADYAAVAKAAAENKGSGSENQPPKSKVLDGTRETAGDNDGPTALEGFFGSGLAAVENL